MTLNERIQALTNLGEYLNTEDERFGAHINRASVDNPWFTEDNIHYALKEISGKWLQRDALENWTANLRNPDMSQRVGVILAGNIPLVGFHDVLSVFISGHVGVIKLSEKDKYLIPFLILLLGEIDPRTRSCFEIAEKLQDFDAVIATGSNNSARYFEYYFGKYPHIIRRNRNAVAVLDGKEGEDELAGLCEDVFTYFGLGCRSVSHCFVPEGYDFIRLIGQMKRYEYLANHNKYKNNLEYNMALHILNKTPHIALPHVILSENAELISPIGCLHYSFYQDRNVLTTYLLTKADDIQCVVANDDIESIPSVRPGQAQRPSLDDYADGINTLTFLQDLTR